MEEISFKGEKYVKASRIAEKLGYTADYVGQLCRSKQIDATLVGRSWYVSEKSISEHKKSRYRSTLSKSKESIRKIAEERSSLRNLDYRIKKTSYDLDDSDLIPVVVKQKRDFELNEEVFERNIQPRKSENEPFIENLAGSSEKYHSNVSNNISHHTTRDLPPVRIISAKSVDMSSLSSKSHTREAGPVTSYRRQQASKSHNLLKNMFIWIFLMSVSVGLFLVLVGLEKRVVIIEDAGQVILYNFSFEHLKNISDLYFFRG